MKYPKLLTLSLLLPCAMSLQAQRLPAFPGAEGFGKFASGGRGGKVVYVTNLNDVPTATGPDYEGSLRQALSTPGAEPITVVFRCGGVIRLAGAINLVRSDVTIAGQTAMGDGICLANYGLNISGSNIVVRHVRFRVGDEINQNNPALNFSNGQKAIFDHCSFSWSVEENVNITDVDSISLQWCINSESLYNSVHTKGARAYAAQWGGENSSYHHNLLAHHNSRMPRQNGNTANDFQLTFDYRNNVHYNWGNSGAFYGGGVEQNLGFSHSNLINNYYLPGPATTTTKDQQYFCAPSGARDAVASANMGGNLFLYGPGLWWLSGNVMKDNPDKTSDNFSGLNPSAAVNHVVNGTSDPKPSTYFNATSEFLITAPFAVTTTSAEEAFEQVLASAGATLPMRDSIDQRIVRETRTQTAVFGGTKVTSGAGISKGKGSGIIDTQSDTKPDGVAVHRFNAWVSYYKNVTQLSASEPDRFKREQIFFYQADLGTVRTQLMRDTVYVSNRLDTDLDGMPDAWERANGLDPHHPDDRNLLHSSGYTMLEVYLNSIDGTEDHISTEPTSASASNYQPLRAYPNPTSEELRVENEELKAGDRIDLYSLSGSLHKTFTAAGKTTTLNLSALPAGTYLIKAGNGVAKVVKN
jgi:hypothetical protein